MSYSTNFLINITTLSLSQDNEDYKQMEKVLDMLEYGDVEYMNDFKKELKNYIPSSSVSDYCSIDNPLFIEALKNVKNSILYKTSNESYINIGSQKYTIIYPNNDVSAPSYITNAILNMLCIDNHFSSTYQTDKKYIKQSNDVDYQLLDINFLKNYINSLSDVDKTNMLDYTLMIIPKHLQVDVDNHGSQMNMLLSRSFNSGKQTMLDKVRDNIEPISSNTYINEYRNEDKL